MEFKSIDIFCDVIDNYGDLGVTYRFARELKQALPHCQIRVFINKTDIFHVIIPNFIFKDEKHILDNITFIDLTKINSVFIEQLQVAELVIEMFACQIPDFYFNVALNSSNVIINLEYLSAENWVEGYHLKESLIPQGGSVKKFFYMPGLTPNTGGILLNSSIEKVKKELKLNPRSLLEKYTNPYQIDLSVKDLITISLFSYEKNFTSLFQALQSSNKPTIIFVFGEKSQKSIQFSLNSIDSKTYLENNFLKTQNVTFIQMPFISQDEFDRFLFCTHINIVRGEDSLARAILAGKPFLWHAYIQDNKYQLVKVKAFLDYFEQFFESASAFLNYKTLLNDFNNQLVASYEECLNEDYQKFLNNLNEISHATEKMSYFVAQNCNLLDKFLKFLDVL